MGFTRLAMRSVCRLATAVLDPVLGIAVLVLVVPRTLTAFLALPATRA